MILPHVKISGLVNMFPALGTDYILEMCLWWVSWSFYAIWLERQVDSWITLMGFDWDPPVIHSGLVISHFVRSPYELSYFSFPFNLVCHWWWRDRPALRIYLLPSCAWAGYLLVHTIWLKLWWWVPLAMTPDYQLKFARAVSFPVDVLIASLVFA